MLFFTIHHIIQNLPLTNGWQESKKNIVTFLVGAISYVFLTSFLNSKRYAGFTDANFFTFTLKNWLLWIIGIDIFAMAIVYKCYWGRTILSELPETWGDSTVPLSQKSMMAPRFAMNTAASTEGFDDLESNYPDVNDDHTPELNIADKAVDGDAPETDTQVFPVEHDEEMEPDSETIHIKAN